MAEITKVFGIDLGTTYSAVAHIDEFDRAIIVPNDINEPTTPSVVYFESPENVVVGVPAGAQGLFDFGLYAAGLAQLARDCQFDRSARGRIHWPGPRHESRRAAARGL